MWKVFLVIAMVVLGAAGYVGWGNQQKLVETVGERKRTEGDLQLARDNLEKAKADIRTIDKAIEDLITEIGKVQEQKSSLEGTKLTDSGKLAQVKEQFESTNAELVKSREFLKLVPQIEKVREDLAASEQRIKELEQSVANAEASVAQASVQKQKVEDFAAEKAALLADISAGRIRGEFSSSVKKAFNDWGFVIIDGGSDQGVVKLAQLDVVRGGQPICKLLVTSVEPGEAAAEVIPGSLTPGQIIQEGDTVTKAAVVTPPVVPAAAAAANTPATPDAATPDPAAPAPDPAAPAGMDPFGAPAEAPAPAAPAGMDPFGAPAAPATPPSDAAADPFAPAPAAPAAPAPAAPADPFAP